VGKIWAVVGVEKGVVGGGDRAVSRPEAAANSGARRCHRGAKGRGPLKRGS